MNSDPAVLWYADNFLNGTMFMTDDQVGKYARALSAQQLHGHLTFDQLNVFAKNDATVLKKFVQDSEGLYYNVRMDNEKKKRAKNSEYQSQRAKKRYKSGAAGAVPGQCPAPATCEHEYEHEYEIKHELEIKERFEKRATEFTSGVNQYTNYPVEMRNDFIAYWTEPNKSHTKMRFELQPTWDTGRRLNTWSTRAKDQFSKKPKTTNFLSGGGM